MNPAILLVTCCLENSRSIILDQVIDNIIAQIPDHSNDVIVFDNASTDDRIVDRLKRTFKYVHQSDRNVGYWSAIDWWLQSAHFINASRSSYTYIIESDMMHYAYHAMEECMQFLDEQPDVGSVRLHEYSIANCRLYDKDRPVAGSRSGLWQSHTNKITGHSIKFDHHDLSGKVWRSNFLTQLPALNRLHAMKQVFAQLNVHGKFTELTFQQEYWKFYQSTGILDGGMYNCDMNPYGSKVITGSWSDPATLERIGYKQTRYASIVPLGEYKVRLLT